MRAISENGEKAKEPVDFGDHDGADMPQKRSNFVSADKNAKQHLISKIERIVRKAHLDYPDFLYICQQVRKRLGLTKPRRSRKLPRILPESLLREFFRVIQGCGNLQHEIMLKMLFFTAVRVGELTRIKVEDVDLENCKIFIECGKGAKDRYILFPESYRLVLKTFLESRPGRRYLFETRNYRPFTPRRIQQIVTFYRMKAGLSNVVSPHLFRHQMITFLTAAGLTDAQIQLISGHENKKSLEIYQHLSLENVHEAYQRAIKSIDL